MRQPLFWRLAFAGLAVFLCVLLTGHFWLPRDYEKRLPDGQAQGHLPQKAGQLVQREEATEWPPCRGPVDNETVPGFAPGAQTHWYSYRPVDEKEVTLVTWLPHDRLDLLRQQCEAWPHTISATVFVVKTYLDQLVCMAPRGQARGGSANATSPAPAPAPGAAACAYKGMSLGALRKNLTDWNVAMMEAGKCNLRLQLQAISIGHSPAVEKKASNSTTNTLMAFRGDEEELEVKAGLDQAQNMTASAEPPLYGSVWDLPYPSNALRNLALAAVESELVFVVDVEFLPSLSLTQELLDAKALEMLRSLASRGGVVVPAFEPLGRRAARSGLRGAQSLLEGGKYAAELALQTADLQPSLSWAGQHGDAEDQCLQWLAATEPFALPLSPVFAPFVLAERYRVPWFDERADDEQALRYAVLQSAGFGGLVVHPSAFVVQFPTPKPALPAPSRAALGPKQLSETLSPAAAAILEELGDGRYTPVVGSACNAPLPQLAQPALH